ncbi:hypothetical protein ACFYVL_14080 [Streptomyces sp. NPDC004111]|uniref:hypothetical protein n=1 Tax=Streptomyces sp. NPDC004111 TaxID=3364690 RepID=UPI003681F374
MSIKKFGAAILSTAVMGAGLALAGPATEAQAAERNVACAQVKGNPAGTCFTVKNGSWYINLWDNKCDGHEVYAEYYVNPVSVKGYGSKAYFKPKPNTQCGRKYTTGIALHTRGYKVKIRVCIEDWGPNTCSGWAYGRP